MVVPATKVPAALAACAGSISSVRYAIAIAGTPPMSKPSRNRPASRSSKEGANGTSRPTTAATVTEIVIALTRPIRSATVDQGITPMARPMVEAEIVSAAVAAPMCRSAAISGSTACGE